MKYKVTEAPREKSFSALCLSDFVATQLDFIQKILAKMAEQSGNLSEQKRVFGFRSEKRDIFRLQGRHEQPLDRVFALAYPASC